jgi:hypothetical protein
VQLTSISSGPTHQFAGIGNVMVAVYVGAPETSALHARVPWIERTIRRYGAIGQLVVVDREASGSLPDREFREVSRQQAERYRGSILFSASVIEGSGVHHALVRTFLRGLALVAAKDLPVRFFEEVSAGAEWCHSLVREHGGPSADDLRGAVAALRPRPPLVAAQG